MPLIFVLIKVILEEPCQPYGKAECDWLVKENVVIGWITAPFSEKKKVLDLSKSEYSKPIASQSSNTYWVQTQFKLLCVYVRTTAISNINTFKDWPHSRKEATLAFSRDESKA